MVGLPLKHSKQQLDGDGYERHYLILESGLATNRELEPIPSLSVCRLVDI
jgi:hypothetical protein